uniref:FAT domain-containing protein n=1 Tax=Angiostrongylus cantonensis TaxID=6313 RepID=A0A158P778_ANGCA
MVTTTITRLLSRLDGDFHKEHLQLINKLADLTQSLIERLLTVEPSNSSDTIESLHSYYSFLLNTDSIFSHCVRGEWIASYCESRWRALLKAGKHGAAMKIRRITTAALALCSGENASSVWFSIMPTEEQLIQVLEAASAMESSASSVSLTVFEIVGDMVSNHTKFPLTSSVAFLSLPWLTDPELQLQSKRHMTSLPLLKEMTRLAKMSVISNGDESVLVNTLSALSLVQGFCDWRRTILLSAMSSHRSALVQNSGVDMSCVLNALSHSVCASHPINRVSGTAGVTCSVCGKMISGTPIQERDKIDQLTGLFELLIQVLTDHKYKKEKHIRLEAAGLLLSAICHVQCPSVLYLQLVKASLGLVNDEDEDAFCSDIVNELLSLWRIDDDYSDEIFCEEIDNVLQTAQELFSFENVSSFIRSSVYIVPLILLSDVENRETAVKLLDRLKFHLSKHRQDLISEYFPSVLEKPLNLAKRKFLKTFIKDYCDLDLKHLFYTKRFLCIVYVLQSIALDTQGYLEILQNMFSWQIRSHPRETFSLTAVMKFNCEYLGFLLSFRRSLLDDDHYEQRSDLLASFATIIKLIDEKFLEETCNKVMVVLRAATSVGEGSIAVWTEFVHRLSDRDAFERTAMVLVNSESRDSSRINFHLRRIFTDDSTERVISGFILLVVWKVVCSRFIQITFLSYTQIPALLHTMRTSGDGSLRVLSSQCLGRLGAVDPGRIGSAGVTSTLDQKRIVFVDDAKEFYVDILESAWRVYSSILDADILDQVEYALQSLLSVLVGKADEYGIMERPIVDHVSGYEDWLLQCFIIGFSKVRQHPEKELFKALKWIVFAKDTVFTRHVLPQLVIRLIIENNESVINEYCDEMTSVLRRVTTNAAGWVRLAAHVVFSVLDTLEQYAIRRLVKQRNNDKLQLIKCLLRLNQPQLALNTAISFYEIEDISPQLASSLMSSQLEATWHLRDWGRLEKMVQQSDPLLDRDDSSWGASCASILCAVKRRESCKLSERLLAARQRLVERITAKTIEDSNTYTQAYKYIVKLARSESVVQCSNILEPILRVRRELLRAAGDVGSVARPDLDNALMQLLVQSCRLARQSGHLQIAWTFLVEAKALGVNLKDVGMEEARFQFQKGNQSQAIGLLTKLLNTKFAEMNQLFTSFVQWHESGAKNTVDSPEVLVKRTSKESRAAFAENHCHNIFQVQLLRAEYMLKSGAVAATDLYQIYLSLQKFDVPSEDLHYRVAVFCDGMYSIDTEKTDAVQLRGDDARSTEMNKRDNADIAQMNSEISRAFRQLDSYAFYTAFPQLISRIVHPNASVFSTLKAILADLICRYPHQCLWQSIAVYRSGPWQKNIRQERFVFGSI